MYTYMSLVPNCTLYKKLTHLQGDMMHFLELICDMTILESSEQHNHFLKSRG